MASKEHLKLLMQGKVTWEQWRREHPEIQPNLTEADLSGINLEGVNLSGTNLSGANLIHANLCNANLDNAKLNWSELKETNFSGASLINADLTESGPLGADGPISANLSHANLTSANLMMSLFSQADFTEAKLVMSDLSQSICEGAIFKNADLTRAKLGADFNNADFSYACLHGADLSHGTFFMANLSYVDLSEACLKGVNLSEANLSYANLTYADLSDARLVHVNLTGANLNRALLIGTNLSNSNLTNCSIYGISAWDAQLEGATQINLGITRPDQPTITVDNLKVAQFIYLLLSNEEIRNVINTIGQKGVLILGRFSKERKPVLDTLSEKLRTLNYIPIVFDFERPTQRDFTETIMTLAGLSCFIIADITNPKSSPLELQATVPNYMIPFVPLLQEGEEPFSMFRDLKGKYHWVLDTLVYDTPFHLMQGLEKAVVKPALEKRDELLTKKMEQLRIRHIEEYLS